MAKILVIEDEELMLKALDFRLKKDGYEVDTALDGRAALLLIEANTYDLIITDIMIPFVSGLEIVNKVKSNPANKTPIIILSGVGLENVVLEAFKLGADDYMTKPFIINELSVRVRKLLRTF